MFAGSVTADERIRRDGRIRLFCALRLPDATVDELVAWQAAHLQPEHLQGEHLQGEHPVAVRIVPPEHLHITLAFLGSRPAEEVPTIVGELAAAARGAGEIRLRATGYRETRSVGMVVLDDPAGAATAFAADVGERLERLGVYRREQRPWLPHITVLRFAEPPRLRPPVPDLGEVDVVRASLYSSSLRPGGARYDALETVVLGGR